jgi:hypothetical protein
VTSPPVLLEYANQSRDGSPIDFEIHSRGSNRGPLVMKQQGGDGLP